LPLKKAAAMMTRTQDLEPAGCKTSELEFRVVPPFSEKGSVELRGRLII